MADYNRTVWKDHIKDQYGNVIQQGVPVSAKNLNNIENQLVVLSAKENTLAELVRESIPSGFTTLSDLDYTYMSTNPNTIKLGADSIAFVNGYKVTIPAGTVIQLDAAPTSGSRDDLIFLECWKQQDANGSVSWNYRIRVVDGVDFSWHPDGLRHYGENSAVTPVYPQGALSAPYSGNTSLAYQFQDFKDLKALNGDSGLFRNNATISGASMDGYVYAIPMFKIHRRNSGGYSANNGNGANSYALLGSFDFTGISANQTKQITIDSSIYSILKVGDKLVDRYYRSSYVTVLSLDGNNKISVAPPSSAYGIMYLVIMCDRPELYQYGSYNSQPQKWLYSNIIADRDVIDLRHQVSLTGFDYQQLLEDNWDKLLTSQLQTNSKVTMLKTYHGISKTPIDSNHIFYASFDGTVVAEKGGSPTGNTASFIPFPTGLGVNSGLVYPNILPNGLDSNKVYTLDMFLQKLKTPNAHAGIKLSGLLSGTTMQIELAFPSASNNLYAEVDSDADGVWDQGEYPSLETIGNSGVFHYIRIVLDFPNSAVRYYRNGNLIKSSTFIPMSNDKLQSIKDITFMDGNGSIAISDFSVSNIDRGTTFATLPQDVIDGYARIDKAFNEQRNVFSDALTSEIDIIQVKCGGGNGKAVTLGDAADWIKDDTTKWNSGDRVKIKGLGGEMITGVADSDTALCQVIGYVSGTATQGSTNIITVDDISKLAVGDTVNYYLTDFNISGILGTISAIDSTTKNISIMLNNTAYIGQSNVGRCVLLETTASTSAPTVQYLNGSTLATVSGTWSNLGTNEATFTLGTNANLTNQDLCITYGLNETIGQGGISEVLNTTLAAESNGKKLIPNPSVTVRDDFAGKVSGSVNINPNISKWTTSNNALIQPSYFTSESQTTYDKMSALDGNSVNIPTSSNGMIPQQLFSFNLIRILEDKFGTLPCGNDVASKVAWLKANISKITCNWWGYGNCPSGNKAMFAIRRMSQADWADNATIATGSSPSLIQYTILSTNGTATPANTIDDSGFLYCLAHTDVSDGITPSAIYTDYINIEITLNTPTGYDMLAPENPRRDDGKSNILLIRKETKEIQSMFARGNNDGIVTYGEYVPIQVISDNSIFRELYISPFLFVTTQGTGGKPLNNYSSSYKNILKNFILPSSDISFKLNNSNIDFNGSSSPWNTASIKRMLVNNAWCDNGLNSIYGGSYSGELKALVLYVSIRYSLIQNSNGEIYLQALTSYPDNTLNNIFGGGNNTVINTVKISNRPLIK